MGDPSALRFVPASIASTPIDWSRIPEATKKKFLERWGYDWMNEVDRPLPTTIADLAKTFDESKFFGYFSSDLCEIIMDISEFGLQAAPDQDIAGPRFYMKYLEQVWYLLFIPGKRDCIMGNSPDIAIKDEDEDERQVADEVALAQQFDARLEQDVSRGLATLVKYSQKLGGWSASTLESTLESAQYAEAIMTLPHSHPAQRELFASMFRTIR